MRHLSAIIRHEEEVQRRADAKRSEARQQLVDLAETCFRGHIAIADVLTIVREIEGSCPPELRERLERALRRANDASSELHETFIKAHQALNKAA